MSLPPQPSPGSPVVDRLLYEMSLEKYGHRPSSAPGYRSRPSMPAAPRCASPVVGRPLSAAPTGSRSQHYHDEPLPAGTYYSVETRSSVHGLVSFAAGSAGAGPSAAAALEGPLLASADQRACFEAGIKHSGWLRKCFGHGHKTKWKRLWVSGPVHWQWGKRRFAACCMLHAL